MNNPCAATALHPLCVAAVPGALIAKVAAKLNLDVRELLTLAKYSPDLFEGTGSSAGEHLAETKIRPLVDDSKNIGQLHRFLRALTLEKLDERPPQPPSPSSANNGPNGPNGLNADARVGASPLSLTSRNQVPWSKSEECFCGT